MLWSFGTAAPKTCGQNSLLNKINCQTIRQFAKVLTLVVFSMDNSQLIPALDRRSVIVRSIDWSGSVTRKNSPCGNMLRKQKTSFRKFVMCLSAIVDLFVIMRDRFIKSASLEITQMHLGV